MDFSLDGAFGKTSFKLDMPDIAFSISPKKSSKSKENNSEGESTEGSRQEKNGKFDFSFDFNGEGNGQTLHDNPSSHGKELMKHDSAVEEKEKNADVSRDGDGNKNGETGTMVVGSLPSDGQKVKDEPHLLDNRKMSVDIKPSRSKEIAFIEVFGKIPSLKLDKPNSDPCCYSKKPSKFNKKLAVEGLDKGTCQEKIDKLSSPLRLTVKLDAAPISEEDKVVGVVETLGKDNFTLATAASSAANIFKSMNSEVASNTEIQRSGFEDSPAPADSKPTQANPISVQNQVSGANNFSMVRGTNDGAGMKLTIAESKKTGSTPVGASDLGDDTSYERDVEEFDDSSSSCAKEILKQDSAVEKRGKMLIYPVSYVLQGCR